MTIAETTVETAIAEVALEAPVMKTIVELAITHVSIMSIATAVVVRARGERCGEQQTNGQTTQQSFHLGSFRIGVWWCFRKPHPRVTGRRICYELYLQRRALQSVTAVVEGGAPRAKILSRSDTKGSRKIR